MSFLIKRPLHCAAAAAAVLAAVLAVSAASGAREPAGDEVPESVADALPETAPRALHKSAAGELEDLEEDLMLGGEDTGLAVRSSSASTAATAAESADSPARGSSGSSAAPADSSTIGAAISSLHFANLAGLQQAARSFSASKTGHAAPLTSTTTVDGGEFTVTLTEPAAGPTSGAGSVHGLGVALQLAAAWAMAVPL
ncbi:hypothetical protein H4R21_004203 [Coemansia helicoidea]|uniref:Uncharacterized protein n=1 Tax=Coemansia helicoidea TaxID=1286919 RepID=A0ACC1KZY1_9FUNG|nr:hypothetical protein H4R21_004203 [Coemansia helicoidea]